MQPLVRRVLIGLTAAAGLVEGGAMLYLRLNENSMVYKPFDDGGGPAKPLPDSLQLASEEVHLVSADGTQLAGIAIPPADTVAQWVIFLHGNAGNVTSMWRPRFYRELHAHGLGVATVDYRGYGNSEPRAPNEQGLYDDARVLYDWLCNVRKVPPSRIIIYGNSLGGAVATELALRVEASGLILESTFTSLPDLGAELYPWIPVRLFATQRFANIEKIGRVAMPKLLLHGTTDSIAPIAHGRRLFAAAAAPKEFVELKGNHTQTFVTDSVNYWSHVSAFVLRLRSDLPAGESPPPPAR